MATINTTTLTTSGNQPISIPNGSWTLTADGSTLASPQQPVSNGVGVTASDVFSLFDLSSSILVWDIDASAWGGYTLGFFHGIAFGVTASGVTGNSVAQITVSADLGQGGAYMGATASAGIDMQVTEGTLEWVGGWDGGFQVVYESALSVDVDLTFDLLNIVFLALSTAGVNAPFFKELSNFNADVSLGGIYGIQGSASNTMASTGTATITPTMDIDLNILDEIPGFGEVVKAVSDAGGNIGFGPVFGIEVPITINLEQLVTTETGNNGTSTVVYGNPAPALDQPPNVFTLYQQSGTQGDTVETVSLVFQHQLNEALSIGIFFEIGLLDILNFSTQYTLYTLEDLGANDPGPFYDQIPAVPNGNTFYGGLQLGRVVFEQASA